MDQSQCWSRESIAAFARRSEATRSTRADTRRPHAPARLPECVSAWSAPRDQGYGGETAKGYFVASPETRRAAARQRGIADIQFRVIGGLPVLIDVWPGVAAVRPTIPTSEAPVTKRGHLPANRFAADVARAGQLPSDAFPVLIGFLIDVPDLDRFLGRISFGVSGGEVLCIQVLTKRVAHGQLELEQILESQTERGDTPVDVARRKRRPYCGSIAVCFHAIQLDRPGAVFFSLPIDGFGGKLISGGAGRYQLIRRVRYGVPVKPENVGAVVGAIELEQQNISARLKPLQLSDQTHGWYALSKVTVRTARPPGFLCRRKAEQR
ncbi:hypothetical protein ALP09_04742 [Pseudomonas amygdali pv. lachrymans]|nr:hypothetical protein ALP09_04742 [Pseudomonas amygdali pv. lachrymans]